MLFFSSTVQWENTMKHLPCLILVLFLVAVQSLDAATVTISFGGALGLRYSPTPLSVNVGDTIEFSGDFTTHPLQSTTVPNGAAAFQMLSGGTTTFRYAIAVAGAYNYQCNVHASYGMTGTFTAGPAGVAQPADMKSTLDPVFPNPAVRSAMVHFNLEKQAHVTLRVYDATGKLVRSLGGEAMEPGIHMLTIDTQDLTPGNYEYVLEVGAVVLRRAMIVVK